MADRPSPVLRAAGEVVLAGTMAVYGSQTEASREIPRQWRAFRLACPAAGPGANYYGASPCTGDHKIHYLAGAAREAMEGVEGLEPLTLEAGEYAVVRVEDPAALRDTWVWLLREWLPNSGRRERQAPEFERFTGISESGAPVGPVEIWIPLEAVAGS